MNANGDANAGDQNSRVAIVTGASRGIGAETAQVLTLALDNGASRGLF